MLPARGQKYRRDQTSKILNAHGLTQPPTRTYKMDNKTHPWTFHVPSSSVYNQTWHEAVATVGFRGEYTGSKVWRDDNTAAGEAITSSFAFQGELV